jgi:hypothetical protein
MSADFDVENAGTEDRRNWAADCVTPEVEIGPLARAEHCALVEVSASGRIDAVTKNVFVRAVCTVGFRC